jgi:5-methyltetrahydrofolate--homocysteine methyltransferase
MVDAETIIKAVKDNDADLVGLSGLITPSLDEMVHIIEAFNNAGLTVPVLIGGATTSKLHTAVKIAPKYHGVVVHVSDASQNPIVASQLLNEVTKDKFVQDILSEYAQVRQTFNHEKTDIVSYSDARKNRVQIDWSKANVYVPKKLGRHIVNLGLSDVISHINWAFFFNAWKLDAKFAGVAFVHDCIGCQQTWLNQFDTTEYGKAEQAVKLYQDAKAMLKRIEDYYPNCCQAVINLTKAYSDGDNIFAEDLVLPMLRQQSASNGLCASLADFIAPKSANIDDYIGMFAVSISVGIEDLKAKFEANNDDYSKVILQTLCDRLAEAASEYLHQCVRKHYWGYADNESLTLKDLFSSKYDGIRPAVGYPSLPDQSLIFKLDKCLHLQDIGVKLTDNGAMLPTSSVCGLYFANKEAFYFGIGKIDSEQLDDYAERSQSPINLVKKYLIKNI